MQSFKLKFIGVTILQGVEFPIFLLIFEWALQQCSATALPVINSNWHSISYRFGLIAAYCSNFGHRVFLAPLGGLGTTYDVHLGLTGKRVVDFLLVLIKLFISRYYG